MKLFKRKPKLVAKKLSSNRKEWLELMNSLAEPVLDAGENGTLKQAFPEDVSRLAAVSGVLCGLSSFLEAPVQAGEESMHRALLQKARLLLMDVINPDSPDACPGFTGSFEPDEKLPALGLLAFALLKAKRVLMKELEPAAQKLLLSYLQDAKYIRPKMDSEEVLFSAMLELAIYELSGDCETQNLDYAVTTLMDHYRGDGVFAPAGQFHWDYLNTFYVHPLLELLLPYLPYWFRGRANAWEKTASGARARMLVMQARMISPDGSYPVLGYGMCLRAGAFHTLAHGALREDLPRELPYPCVRELLWRVMKRTLTPKGTQDQNGFLRPGLCGFQPSLCEPDFTTGQLYGCMAVFAPLGLPQNHAFWGVNTSRSLWQQAWIGENIPLDHCH